MHSRRSKLVRNIIPIPAIVIAGETVRASMMCLEGEVSENDFKLLRELIKFRAPEFRHFILNLTDDYDINPDKARRLIEFKKEMSERPYLVNVALCLTSDNCGLFQSCEFALEIDVIKA